MHRSGYWFKAILCGGSGLLFSSVAFAHDGPLHHDLFDFSVMMGLGMLSLGLLRVCLVRRRNR